MSLVCLPVRALRLLLPLITGFGLWRQLPPLGGLGGVVAGPRSDSTGCGSDAVSSWLGPTLGARHVLTRTKSLWLQGQALITFILPVPAGAFDTAGSGLEPEEKEALRSHRPAHPTSLRHQRLGLAP